jgi:aspartokinase-like uncharacterized kinase
LRCAWQRLAVTRDPLGGVITIKVGGAALRQPEALDRIADAITRASRVAPLLLVPGGGVFADEVRAAEKVEGLSPSEAHWRAVRAMESLGELLVKAIPPACSVSSVSALQMALQHAQVPVLAPFDWLQATDPLPHSWDVTSDSIAAWVAGQIGSPLLVLIKPVGGPLERLVDAHFFQVLPAGVEATILAEPEVSELEQLLRARLAGRTHSPHQSRRELR